ncbi:hypothetical protein K32_12620 [Kaistia sp. 32K]|uniref:hypothetical protein n=1 Tax=Kaistia sp. 32K TaxID=2795690 RepID=UPI0019168AC4|nr:hypothetical protein [Kaistia sp. 32K]BCP52645.1 hypothetical protein K32_12620 [Kaistia sp. 32K]
MQFEPAQPESKYLNHAEDLALLLETLPHRLDLVDGVLAWRPVSRRPVLAGPADHRARRRLDDLTTRLDRQAAAAQDAVREAVRAGKLELLWPIASVAGKELRPVIAEARDAIAASRTEEESDVPLARIA